MKENKAENEKGKRQLNEKILKVKGTKRKQRSESNSHNNIKHESKKGRMKLIFLGPSAKEVSNRTE